MDSERSCSPPHGEKTLAVATVSRNSQSLKEEKRQWSRARSEPYHWKFSLAHLAGGSTKRLGRKEIVAPTLRSARADLKVGATSARTSAPMVKSRSMAKWLGVDGL